MQAAALLWRPCAARARLRIESVNAENKTASRAPAAGPREATEFHIPTLDGLRALSFMLVFLAHAGLGRLLPGGLGVTIFFFLSGYLVTTLLRIEHSRHGSISLPAFYLRRLLRIWPPFYSVLTLAVVLTLIGALPGALEPRAVLAQFVHYANYWIVWHGNDGQAAGTGVYWSLAVEEHFYLLFPMLYIGLRRLAWFEDGRKQAAFLYGLCALALAWRLLLILHYRVPSDRTYLASDTRMDSILFGCALALGANPVLDRSALSMNVRRRVLLPLGVAGILASLLFRAAWFRETARYSLQGLALTPIFIVAMRDFGWGLFRVFNWKLIRHFGVLSYSLYLLHQVVLFFLEAHLPRLHPFALGTLALGVSVALAELIHRVIERPCARLRKRFSRTSAPSTGQLQSSRMASSPDEA
jgi:peptidoglycan/LPS O-acetylase OafA/YrhL